MKNNGGNYRIPEIIMTTVFHQVQNFHTQEALWWSVMSFTVLV